ncbi:uncharacterized protein BT62DRAFT_925833, partial [Guyanagaster necrorhizus]
MSDESITCDNACPASSTFLAETVNQKPSQGRNTYLYIRIDFVRQRCSTYKHG